MSYLSTKISNLVVSLSSNAFNRALLVPICDSVQVRNYAARKGTRERKKKAKVKVEIQKVGFIPHNLRNRDKLLASRPSRKFDDSWKFDPIDDVYAMRYYKWKVYPFAEAVSAHRETHHPELYNKPESNLFATIELNMQADKKNRFIENFKRTAAIPHKFEHGEARTIIVFAKTVEGQTEAANAGAQLSGGVELIKQIQNGQVLLQDFQHVIAHPDILPELVVLRGILKKKFPNTRIGTLDTDLKSVVDRFLNGISYQAFKDEYEKDFGQIDAVLGTINMDEKHLEENFAALVEDVVTQKPKKTQDFIRRCYLWSPPSREKFKIEYAQYISNKSESSKDNADDADEEVEEERVAL